MADFAGLTIWTDAYIGDTQHLTLQEHGAYLKLLMIAWRDPGCSLPADDKRIATMLGVSKRVWMGLKPEVMSFWYEENGRYFQQRLTLERKKVESKSKKGSDAARKRWDANSLKRNNVHNADASPEHMPQGCPPYPSPTLPLESPSDSCATNSLPLFGGQQKSEAKPPDRFEEFWNAYPHRGGAKKGKAAARKKWEAAIKRKVDPQTMITGAVDFQRDRKAVDGFAPDPARWLHGEMWMDEIEEVKGQDNGNRFDNGGSGGGSAGPRGSANGGYHDALLAGFGQAALNVERGTRSDGFGYSEDFHAGSATGNRDKGGSGPE